MNEDENNLLDQKTLAQKLKNLLERDATQTSSIDEKDRPTLQSGPQDQDPFELKLSTKIEAILFASPEPIRATEIYDFLSPCPYSLKEVSIEIETVCQKYQKGRGGFHLQRHDKGYRFETNLLCSPYIERMFSEKPRPLSRAAQETLAIIAYRQPVTRADIEFIRGVDAGSMIKNLLDRELIHCLGRKDDSGRPMMFGTTSNFLSIYNLKSLNDLPPLSAFQTNQDTIKNALTAIPQNHLSGFNDQTEHDLMKDEYDD